MTLGELRRSRSLAAGVLLLATLGCGGDSASSSQVATHPTKGRVLVQGKPATGVLVFLQPVSETPGVPRPSGQTDADGNFTLHTYLGDDGAPAGSYKVGIAVTSSRGQERNVMEKGAALAASPPAVAARYALPDASGLTAEVKPGDNNLPPFKLD